MVAQYHIYYMDYSEAESQLRTILEDELNFYGMKKAEAAPKEEVKDENAPKMVDLEKPVFIGINLEQINQDILADKEITESTEY